MRLSTGRGVATAFAEGCVDTLCAALRYRDGDTGEHMRRVGLVTALLLRTLAEETAASAKAETSGAEKTAPGENIPPREIERIAAAAVLHDAGKLRTPDAILKKPGRLTAEETAVMRRHAAEGCEILDAIPGFAASPWGRYARDICRWHHERWDGSGYPDGLRGGETPVWARAAAVADVFDALTSPRCYHEALPPEEAAGRMARGEYGSFDPALLSCLLARLGELRGLYTA